MESFGLDKQSKPRVISVSQLNQEARRLLENNLSMVWVEGELSNVARPASGHWYFTLKDNSAQIRCAMFKNRNRYAQINPLDGQAVVVRGRISLYEARGDYQLIAENLQEAGVGKLQQRFEALKETLTKEGLFAQERKQNIPPFPKRIGVITSPTGAAIRDVLNVLGRRFPSIPVRIYPVAVQGQDAAAQIERALNMANQRNDCDVLLLARGGGSIEDLWPFNEEIVARAIHQSAIPIISAVGHETDVTISDFTADIRAPTPSAAAELLVPDTHTLKNTMSMFAQRLHRAIAKLLTESQDRMRWLGGRHRQCRPGLKLAQYVQRLDDMDGRLRSLIYLVLNEKRQMLDASTLRMAQRSPLKALEKERRKLERASQSLHSTIYRRLIVARNQLELLATTLNAVGPQTTLERGYSIIVKDGNIVRSAQQLQRDDTLHIRLADGSADAVVTHSKKIRQPE